MKIVALFMPVLTTIITGCALATDDAAALSPESSEQTNELSETAIRGLPDSCFANTGGQLVRLDLATETITETPDRFDDGLLSSLGLTQNHVVACLFPTGVVDILDLATGVHTQVDMPCDSATAIGDKIYVNANAQTLTEYADLRALIAKTPLRTLPRLFASRVGAGAGRLLAAWHSDDEILALDLDTGVSTAIPLPGHGDDWIFGLFENAHVRLVAAGWVQTGLEVYDTASGRLIRRLFDGTFLEGLACTTAR